MLIVMKPRCTPEDLLAVEAKIRSLGFAPHAIPGANRTAIGVTGNQGAVDPLLFATMSGVAEAIRVTQPFKLVSREVKDEPTCVSVGKVRIGAGHVAVIAGPCAVESREQILQAAHAVKASGASLLRGGAYKPRTSPYDFQGLREEGLELLALARQETGLGIVTEVKDTESLALVAQCADMLQIGARNMQNFSLLERVGELRKPVLLKRGSSATVKELLMAAEYIVARGNTQVVLCERGIRTFETSTRNTLDINAVPLLKSLTHLPVMVDPSHAIGIRALVPAVARAAIAAGADGLIVEVHPKPEQALSDGPQSLTPSQFERLMGQVRGIVEILSETLEH
jgi:3-deoxy-7-phosphoheptulonate synthase